MGSAFDGAPEDHLEQTPTAKIQRIQFTVPHPILLPEVVSALNGEPTATADAHSFAAEMVLPPETGASTADDGVHPRTPPTPTEPESAAAEQFTAPADMAAIELPPADLSSAPGAPEEAAVVPDMLIAASAPPEVLEVASTVPEVLAVSASAPVAQPPTRARPVRRRRPPGLLWWLVAAVIILGAINFAVDTNRSGKVASPALQQNIYATSATVTFSAVPVLVSAPETVTVPAAGTGAMPTQVVQTGGYYITTGPIPAPANGQNYTVPANCGDPTIAQNTGKKFLQNLLDQQVKAGMLVLTTTTFTLDPTSVTCVPAAGTTQANPFTYTQTITGGGSEVIVTTAAVIAYQTQQVQTLDAVFLAQTAGTFGPLTLHICAAPTVVPAAQSGVVACAASGAHQRTWDDVTLHNLATKLKGLSKDAARQFLATQPGVAPDSIAVVTDPTTAALPQNAADIAITIA